MKKFQLFPILFLFTFFAANAQDMYLTQLFATANNLNPAFTGFTKGPQLGLQYRNQGTRVTRGYNTTFLSYQMPIHKINSGAGIQIMSDVEGHAIYTTAINLQYAYNINISNEAAVRIGAEAGYVSKTVDFSGLYFGDQIHPRLGFIYPTNEPVPRNGTKTIGFFNAATGAVLSYNKLQAGLALHNVFSPNQSFFGEKSNLARRFSAHGGYFIPLSDDDEKGWVLYPNMVYQRQSRFSELIAGLQASKGIFTFGTSVRHAAPNFDAVNFILGLNIRRFRVGYSYDHTVSSARSFAPGSHEIYLGFRFGKLKPGQTPRQANLLQRFF